MANYKIPERSLGLEWMLQSSQVSDITLIEALQREYYAGLVYLGEYLLDESQKAREFARKALADGVINRDHYWGEISLKAWLYRLAIENYLHTVQQDKVPPFLKGQFQWVVHGVIKRKITRLSGDSETYPIAKDTNTLKQQSGDELSRFRQLLSELGEENCLYLVLRYGHELSAGEIAKVLHGDGSKVPPEDIHTQLDDVRKKIQTCLGMSVESCEIHPQVHSQIQAASDGMLSPELVIELEGNLGACETCRNDANRFEAFEIQLLRFIHLIWPKPLIPPDEERGATVSIVASVNNRSRHRSISVSFKEASLAFILLVLMVAIGWHFNLFTPQARPVQIVYVTPTPYPSPSRIFYYIVKPGDTLDSIANQAGIDPQWLLEFNRLRPMGIHHGDSFYPGRIIEIPVSGSPSSPDFPTPIPFHPISSGLSMESTQQEILQRISESATLWNTVWADIQVSLYGSQGYLGSALGIYRDQIWISQPSHSLLVSGFTTGGPEILQYINDGKLIERNINTGRSSSRQATGLIDDPELKDLFFPQELSLQDGTLQVLRIEYVTGRQALVVDWRNSHGVRVYRLWIDTERGVILHLRRFQGIDLEAGSENILITNIAFDVDFPQDIFDQNPAWPVYYSQDFTGTPLLSGNDSFNPFSAGVPSQ